MKKLLTILALSLIAALSAVSFTACGTAHTHKYDSGVITKATDGLVFTLSDEGTEYSVTGYNGTSTEVYIPSEFYNNKPVTSIGERAFEDCSSLTSITIPDSVTSIGRSAFEGCYKLVEVYNKSSLNITTNSKDNGYVGYYAKAVYTEPYTSKLSTDKNGYIIYMDGGDKILMGYTGKETELTLPADITEIYQYAFYECYALTSITIPDSVTSIGSSAFSWCIGLTSITIPDSVTSIGRLAFYECYALTSITIPDSVTSIGSEAFAYCRGLESITVAAGNTKYRSEGNCLIEKETNTLILGCKNSLIPDSVTSIGDYAFMKCSRLTSITIPDSVTSIGYEAFDGCYNLTSITIPDSVTSIGDWAFWGCSGLTSITIGGSVTSIGYAAFSGCDGLTSITFKGTKEQWNAISKEGGWKSNVPATVVSCSDGDVNI